MAKRNYLNIQDGAFYLTFADAKQTAKNIESVFVGKASWFSIPKPLPIAQLEREYRDLCPDMEAMFPGIIMKII